MLTKLAHLKRAVDETVNQSPGSCSGVGRAQLSSPCSLLVRLHCCSSQARSFSSMEVKIKQEADLKEYLGKFLTLPCFLQELGVGKVG